MNKLLIVLFGGLLIFGLAGVASASPYQDIYSTDVSLNSNGNSYLWNFDLNNDTLAVGDINPGYTITSATLFIAIKGAQSSSIADFGYDLLSTNSVDLSNGTYTYDVLTQVVSDHYLQVLITNRSTESTDHGFTVDYVQVAGNYTTPEPASMLLVGLGLIGLAGARKKFKK